MAGNSKVSITLEYTDDNGNSDADMTVNYRNLDYAGVVLIEKTVVNSLLGLGDAAVAAKATAAQQPTGE